MILSFHGHKPFSVISLCVHQFIIHLAFSHFSSLQYRIGSETESMNSISSTDDTFQWSGAPDTSLRFGDESHGLMDSCL